MVENTIFAKNLKFLREQQNLSQSELSRITIKISEKYNQTADGYISKPINQASIARWEAGENSPSVANLVILSRALNVPLTALINEDYEIESQNKIPILNLSNSLSYYKEPINIVKNIQYTGLNKSSECFGIYLNKNYLESKFKKNDLILVNKYFDDYNGYFLVEVNNEILISKYDNKLKIIGKIIELRRTYNNEDTKK